MDQSKYRVEIFWSDEDGGYIANVPDLRYCSAFGESYEEALREVLVAMELHLDTLREEGRPTPSQRFTPLLTRPKCPRSLAVAVSSRSTWI
jgi:predicted RNase H-like HicB family nuclease